ncbi:DNA-processing protein DprA [Sanguibacter suaedae]|uniref:DNA-protecting protein DprA n=1 Tax=Sanguibacter suaedae TaxID=2795737 RepID=A0A934MBP9_9MICO|nr:DNA-processing protein DprA [Sanguibacter suaedae]MBI9115556.1 DNA-protecting protein DprA [Sanguibacter suaedae]
MSGRARAAGSEVLARAAWSRLAEPADVTAGALVAILGAVEALAWLTTAADGDLDHHVAALAAERSLDATTARRVRRGVDRWRPRLDGLEPARDLDALDRMGGVLVVPGDDGWPTSLDVLGAGAPFCLWVRGAPSPADVLARSVSLVGARASTGYGDRVAGELAAGLAAHGFTTVSGGAYGIDAAAHRGAVTVGGATVAFLAGGVDRLYPAGNSDLLLAMVERGGLVLSEVPPGSVPSRVRFLRRNRLIAAAGAATVVVEAAWRSGSLSTAAVAVDLLRPVGAVPGPVTSMASAGCHRLLREGRAVCVTDAEEVRELAGGLADDGAGVRAAEDARDAVHRGPLDSLDGPARQVFDALPLSGGSRPEDLVRGAGVDEGLVLSALGRLELLGLAARTPGGWVKRRA